MSLMLQTWFAAIQAYRRGKSFQNIEVGLSITHTHSLVGAHTHTCLYSRSASLSVPLLMLEFHTGIVESAHPPSSHK